MNTRTITVHSSIPFPPAPTEDGIYYPHVYATDSGFAYRFLRLSECPIYLNPKTGQKARLVMLLAVNNPELNHGKFVYGFEEVLVHEDTGNTQKQWDAADWFPYLSE